MTESWDAPASRSVRECIRASWRPRSLASFLAGFSGRHASLHFDFGTTDFLTRGHAGARKDGLDVAFGSRESSQFEEMAGRAGGHPKGRAESKRRSQPVLHPPRPV